MGNSALKNIHEFTDKAKVGWKTACKDPKSPFANLQGVETFEKGDEKSHVEIKIPQDARGVTRDFFEIFLDEPTPSTNILGKNKKCRVTVDNDVIPAVVTCEEREMEVKQSEEKVKVPVRRREQKKGRVVVPWKVLPESSDSVYMNINGLYVMYTKTNELKISY